MLSDYQQVFAFFLWFGVYALGGLIGQAFATRAIGRKRRYGCGKKLIVGSDEAPAKGTIQHWFFALRAPGITPPGWVFAAVWTLLYGLNTAAAFCLYRIGHDNNTMWLTAVGLHIGYALVSALWAPVFFGLHSPKIGLAAILLTLGAAVATWAITGVYAVSEVSTVYGFDAITSAWVSFGLFAPQVAWLAFTAGLHVWITLKN
jgi:tryptophan-rich sensory protein